MTSSLIISRLFAAVFTAALSFLLAGSFAAQTPTAFRVGEKLSYNVYFEKYPNAVFVEMQVVSRGAYLKRDAVELHGRIKTDGMVGSLFGFVDEERIVYAAADSGQPLFVKRILHGGAVPKEVEVDLSTAGTTAFDLLTAMYKVRETGGNGSFQIFEDAESGSITFAAGGTERVRTDAGDFDASISTVQSTYFDTRGMKNLRVWFSNDEFHVPVAFAFKTAKGEFRGKLAGLSVDQPVVTPDPTPTPKPTPQPAATPRPTPSPSVYVENQPLLSELGFRLGEQLEYRVSQAGRAIGNFTLTAKERKLVGTQDSLFLVAKATGVEANARVFGLGDTVTAVVNPETLAPRSFDSKLSGALALLTQIVTFDQRSGNISAGPNRIEGPIGVHTLLSMVYAMRSFNLKPSKDPTNPVNDTRVAVFWVDRVYIFKLRPSSAETITLGERKVSAQKISITTENPQLDGLGLQVWLSNEDARQPLRFVVGTYQADLVSATITPPQ